MNPDSDPTGPTKERASRAEMEKRRALVRAYLEKERGTDVSFAALIDHLEKNGMVVSERTLHGIVRELQVSLPSEFALTIDRGFLQLKYKSESVFKGRLEKDPDIKWALARAAWYYLAGLGDPLMKEEAELKPGNVPAGSTGILDKLRALDEKADMRLILDTGTTVGAFGSYMLKAGGFPLVTQVGWERVGDRSTTSHTRFLLPRIVTNSQPFAQEVYESSPRRLFEFVQLGGMLRPKHGSYCGPETMAALKACETSGIDVAVVGTTGYQLYGPKGTKGFACDNYFESVWKAGCLKTAWVRCLMLSSTKLTQCNARNLFVPLSIHELDLVILDDGKTTDRAEDVERFCERAYDAGVSVLRVTKIPQRQL